MAGISEEELRRPVETLSVSERPRWLPPATGSSRRDRRRRCRTLVELNTSGIVAYRKADGSKRRTNY
jgi:hypothetical protein